MAASTKDVPYIGLQERTFPSLGPALGCARLYAIAVDLDLESLRGAYGESYDKAYAEIKKVLQSHGFLWQRGGVYFGGEAIDAVTCVLAADDLARTLPWFAASLRDIRMLRIEELNDLMPAVRQASDS